MLSKRYPSLAAAEPCFQEIVFLSTGTAPDAKTSEIGIPAYDLTVSGDDARNRLLSDFSVQGTRPLMGAKCSIASNQLATTCATIFEGSGGVPWRLISHNLLLFRNNISYRVIARNWNLKLLISGSGVRVPVRPPSKTMT